MRNLLFLLVFAPMVVFAKDNYCASPKPGDWNYDPFYAYQCINNGGFGVEDIFSPEMVEYYVRKTKDAERGMVIFSQPKWSKKRPVGVAAYRLYVPTPTGDRIVRGWMAFQMNEKHLVESIAYTHDPPGKFFGSPAVGQAADMATTFYGISEFGLQEMNPAINAAGLPVATAIKVSLGFVVPHVTDISTCAPMQEGLTKSGWLAAGWNIGVMAGLGTAAVIPAAVAVFFTKEDGFWECMPSDVRNWPAYPEE